MAALADKTYSPLLHTRVAEIKALEQLPEASKDLLFPIVVARPWPNANQLDSTWRKISASFGERRFALDLDEFMHNSQSPRDAAQDFDALFAPENGFENYYSQIEALDHAVPVLQTRGNEVPTLDVQLRHVDRIDRGCVLRVRHNLADRANAEVRRVLDANPETLVYLDLGWTRDLLSREVWASNVLATVADQQPESEVVVSASTFPDSFRPRNRDVEIFSERGLFDALSRRHNALSLTYGDWGSTRAPREASPMRLVRRIDLPLTREWVFFRDSGDEDYADIARRVVGDSTWPSNLNIWGTYVIEGTAEGVPGSIRGQAAAAAARVNIHLHRQTHFGEVALSGDEDVPFVD